MADAPTIPSPETSAQPGTAPATSPTAETLTRAEAQDLANRAAAATRREFETKLEALRADYESKLKTPPQASKTVDAADLLFRVEFSNAMLDVTSELGPIASGARERLRKLASVDKPTDLTSWLRSEIGALGLVKQPAPTPQPAAASTAPVVPANAAAPAGSPAVDLSGPITLEQLRQPGVAQAILAREGSAGMAKRLMSAGNGGQTVKGWSWGK